MPYLYAHNLSTALPSTASSVSSAVSSAFTSAATAGIGNWLKKAALRAAGEEGLAENVRNNQGETFGIDAIHAAEVEKAQEEIRYRMGTQRVHCLDTSGEVFAILLNLIYLAPLAVLFVRYFSRSYLNRAKSDSPKSSKQENIKASSKDAVNEMEREIQEAMSGEQGGSTQPPPETKAKTEKAKNEVYQGASDLSDKAQKNAKDTSVKLQNVTNDLGNIAKDTVGDYPSKAQQTANDHGAKAQKAGKDIKESVNDDLRALQEKMKRMGSEKTKSSKGKRATIQTRRADLGVRLSAPSHRRKKICKALRLKKKMRSQKQMGWPRAMKSSRTSLRPRKRRRLRRRCSPTRSRNNSDPRKRTLGAMCIIGSHLKND